eukprot:m.324946 g.324946  ORF g.324946 m.324946 type:complete len:438 (+) comp20377_c0_seq1:427-1740(+)
MSASQNSTGIAVKVVHGGITRRFTLPPEESIEWIQNKIKGIFSDAVCEGTLTWQDEEGDWVGLLNAEDLAIAVDVSTHLKKPLRLRVEHSTSHQDTVEAPADASSTDAPSADNANEHTQQQNRSVPPTQTPDSSTNADSEASAASGDGGAEEKLFANIHKALTNLRATGVLDLTSVLENTTDDIDVERLIQIALPHLGTTLPTPPPHIFETFAPFFSFGGRCGARACPEDQRTRHCPPRCCKETKSQPTSNAPPADSTAEASASTPASATGSILPSAPLSFGSRGEGVKQLQHFLIAHHLLEPWAIRRFAGFYGPQTARAIWAFQQAQGLHRDDVPEVITPGTFDDATRSALLSLHSLDAQNVNGGEDGSNGASGGHESNDVSAASGGTDEGDAAAGRWDKELATLASMGFVNEELLTQMLDTAGGSVLAVVTKLLA